MFDGLSEKLMFSEKRDGADEHLPFPHLSPIRSLSLIATFTRIAIFYCFGHGFDKELMAVKISQNGKCKHKVLKNIGIHHAFDTVQIAPIYLPSRNSSSKPGVPTGQN